LRDPRSSILLLLLLWPLGSSCATGRLLPCSYAARETQENPTPELREIQPRGRCANLLRDGSLRIQPDHLDQLDFADGLGALLVPMGWYYVTPDGRTAAVVTYDNGPDYFVEGLARTRRGGKIGFIDRSLSERIAPTWDFAFPFDGGVALVCQGCRPRATADGEHSEMRGGVWGYIDHDGAVIVPVRFEREHVPSPTRANRAAGEH
jgi:hypothetical protein